MKERGRKINIFAVVSVLLAVAFITFSFHTATSFIFASSDNPRSIGTTGKVSFTPTDLKNNYTNLSTTTKVILIVEWIIIFIIIIVILIKVKLNVSKEKKEDKNPKNRDLVNMVNIVKKYKKSSSDTELDILYNILKEKKVLGLKTIIQMFRIDKVTALNWCKILEEGDLATLSYPAIGDPKIIVNETEEEKARNEKEEEKARNEKEKKDKKKK